MNMRTTLMLMAATVAAPLSAQQPADVYTTLAAPSTVTATVDQRAEAMPALAIMPADADMCFTFTDIPGFISRLNAVGAIDNEDYANLPEELKAINSIALAGGAGSAATLAAVGDLYNSFQLSEMLPALKQIAADAAPQYADTLKVEVNKAEAANIQAVKDLLAQGKIAPAYGVLVANPGYEAMIAEWYAMATGEMEESATDEDGVEYVSINGFSGLKLQVPADEAQPSPWDDEYEIALKQEAVKRTFYVLLKLEDDKIIAVACEDPSQINTAATPQESILGTDKFAAVDSKLGQGLHMAVYGSNAATNAYNKLQPHYFASIAKTVENMFTALAAQGGADQATFTTAAKGVNTVVSAWQKWTTYTVEKPTLATICWNDKEVDFDMHYDNLGVTAKPAKLSLLNKAADANTIFYAESANWNLPNMPNLVNLIDAGVEIADGVIALAPEDDKNSAAAKMTMVKAFLPEAKEAIEALGTVTSGLGNTYAFVMDGGATMPTVLGGKPGNTTAFPRVAFYSGVTDRSKLSEGWDKLLGVTGKVAEKLGYDAATVNMMPIVPKMIGKATSYSIALPWFTENLVPNLTVSDSAFVLGSSSKLNGEIAETATGTLDFNGAVCTIKFAPLATMLRSLADDMADRAEAEAAAKPAQPAVEDDEEEMVVPVVVEDDEEEEFDDEADYVEEDDFDEEEIYAYHYRESSPAERRAEKFDDAATVVEGISEYVDSINAIFTTQGKDARARIQVKLK